MKHFTFGIAAALIGAIVLAIALNWSYEAESIPPEEKPTPIPYAINPNPAIPSAERIGINLSFWSTWGAGQYMKNVLMNPGFEGDINRLIVIVTQLDNTSFSDGKNLGQEDDFWNGASFEVRSGQSAGTQGKITRSLKEGTGGLPQYFPEEPLPSLAINDVIVLTKVTNPNPVGQWWLSKTGVTVDNSTPPPQSLSNYYAVLTPADSSPAECIFYLDSMGDRAGNLLSVSGPWQLSFWIRGDENTPLIVQFQRLNGSPLFINKIARATNEWQQVTYNFNAQDSETPGTLKLLFSAQTPNTSINLANVSLGPVQSANPHSPWRQEVVEMLKTLRPSYLRDWQGQLGDQFNNRIAKDFARLSWNERMAGGEGSLAFGYSIPDFLDLCAQVQAVPWIIIPTTLTDEELDAFGLFLAKNSEISQFPEIVLEFGNENWNWIFRSLAIPIPAAYGPVSDRAFERIAASAGSNIKIRRVINGQFYNPWLTAQFANSCQQYDTMAVAPYFLFSIDSGTSSSEILNEMFKTNDDLYQQINQELSHLNKNLAVYEVNLHTMNGSMPLATTNQYVTAAVSGSALAKRLIDGMFHKASPQLVFSFTGFDSKAYDQQGFIRLWGIVRDVSSTKRVRPTGLAVTMLNNLIGGSLHKAELKAGDWIPPEEAGRLTLAAFRTADDWGAAVVNANDKEQWIELQFPDDSKAIPNFVQILSSKSFMDNNEDEENVKIEQQRVNSKDRKIQYAIPAYGFCTFSVHSMKK
jgi:hypothetical protein